MVEFLGVSLDPTVDLGRVDYDFKMFKDGDGTVTVELTAQARRQRTFLLPTLSDVLSL